MSKQLQGQAGCNLVSSLALNVTHLSPVTAQRFQIEKERNPQMNQTFLTAGLFAFHLDGSATTVTANMTRKLKLIMAAIALAICATMAVTSVLAQTLGGVGADSRAKTLTTEMVC